MLTDRQVQEIVARCVSTIIYYHLSERSRRNEEGMAADVRLIAASVAEMGMDLAEVDERIGGPVEVELIRRYGHELGVRLLGRFNESFAGGAIGAR